MSYQATTWALGRKTGSPAGKALLLTIANYAGVNGDCYPSIPRLAEETEQSASSVRRWLAELEDIDLIARAARYHESGRRQSDWIILLCDEAAREFARSLGWTGKPPREASAEAASGGENVSPAAPDCAPSEPQNEGGDPSKLRGSPYHSCERVTLPQLWKGDPTTGERARITKLTVKDSLSPPEPEPEPTIGCADRERDFGESVSAPPPGEEAAEWTKFYDLWNWQEVESPIVAKGVFRRLKPPERALALKHAPAYLRDCREKKRRQAFAGNWLTNRGWEEFVAKIDATERRKQELHELQRAKYGGVVIREHTPQFAAWARYERLANGVERIDLRSFPTGMGILRPTEWPPALAKSDVSPRPESTADPPRRTV
jgi:hypothetical protein